MLVKLVTLVSRTPPSYHRTSTYILCWSYIRITSTRKNLSRCLCVSVPVSAASATTGVLKRVKRRWFRRIVRRIGKVVRRVVRKIKRVVKKVVRKIKKVIKKVIKKITRLICNIACNWVLAKIGFHFKRVYVCKKLCKWVIKWSSRQRTAPPSFTRCHNVYLKCGKSNVNSDLTPRWLRYRNNYCADLSNY